MWRSDPPGCWSSPGRCAPQRSAAERGKILALVLIGLGFIAAPSLVFLEVGLSEDRERERDSLRRSGLLA